jgi:hypothetical protein
MAQIMDFAMIVYPAKYKAPDFPLAPRQARRRGLIRATPARTRIEIVIEKPIVPTSGIDGVNETPTPSGRRFTFSFTDTIHSRQTIGLFVTSPYDVIFTGRRYLLQSPSQQKHPRKPQILPAIDILPKQSLQLHRTQTASSKSMRLYFLFLRVPMIAETLLLSKASIHASLF